MKLLITGASGFLGYRLSAWYGERTEYDVLPITRAQMDITDRDAVWKVLSETRPDIVIHCGAISDTSACAQNPVWSGKVNVDGAAHLARSCSSVGARLILCSSDQVYFGNGVEVPHREDEALLPPHEYGRQKGEAERQALKICENTICLRLSWMYAASWRKEEHGNLLRSIAEAAWGRQPLTFPVHDFRSITDVWEVVENMEKVFALPPGIYNFGSPNDLSTYELLWTAAQDIGTLRCLLRENREAFAQAPRNLRMSQEKVNRQKIYFRDSVTGLRDNLMKLLSGF